MLPSLQAGLIRVDFWEGNTVVRLWRGTAKQMKERRMEGERKPSAKTVSSLFCPARRSLAASRWQLASAAVQNRGRRHDACQKALRNPAPEANLSPEPVTNPHRACRQSNLHPHQGERGGGAGVILNRGRSGLFLLQLIAGVLLLFVC